MWPLLVRGDFKRFRLLSHDTVCNRDRTRSGAVNFSLLNNPMGSFTYAMYGCMPTVASHETGWGSRLYLLMGIFTLYSTLPRMCMAVSHPSLANFKCLGTVRRQNYDICVKGSTVLYRERSQWETVRCERRLTVFQKRNCFSCGFRHLPNNFSGLVPWLLVLYTYQYCPVDWGIRAGICRTLCTFFGAWSKTCLDLDTLVRGDLTPLYLLGSLLHSKWGIHTPVFLLQGSRNSGWGSALAYVLGVEA